MKIFRSILSVALVALLLISSMGFSVSRHYCMGMLVEESFFTLSDDCGQIGDACESSENDAHLSCCDDENLVVAGIDVISIVKKQLDLGPIYLSATPLTQSSLSIPKLSYQYISFYPPPDISSYGRDLLVQVQRFLI